MRMIVLGSGAGGGFPQWNCRCPVCSLAWDGDPRVKARTQSSIAVETGDGHWTLFNASPDLRSQILATRQIQPTGLRETPISAVALTNGDVDHVDGLITLRERSPFTVYATSQISAVLDANPIFGVLARDVVSRRTVELGKPFSIDDATIEFFGAPGKVPLYLETENLTIGDTSGDTVGAVVKKDGKRLVYIPGCAFVNDDVLARVEGADLLLFDGTVFEDDEMQRAGVGVKTGRRMGHVPISGPDGSLDAFKAVKVSRKVYIHINNTNPILIEGSPERRAVEARGWEVSEDGLEIAAGEAASVHDRGSTAA
ncbi:pyrroloquinoline quinone biosynthesis protein PqqB [Hansschlegelia zhihuaiae]|uniref:Coenzyme PQQ synthesis protein B n=1 Tax=Hansschlegelia zhihuaiae TaxID=405005 RepID=A0A4V1KJN6_9HYPH|nr:pyrroloquinoline quinone biosynthesis protein PqqB [Hansschlegelia zhihuaiae]RXF74822.1 pyrroloquinoline quinone biosynthesis protein PqqB [Hansschlegelia zhihuaiae]